MWGDGACWLNPAGFGGRQLRVNTATRRLMWFNVESVGGLTRRAYQSPSRVFGTFSFFLKGIAPPPTHTHTHTHTLLCSSERQGLTHKRGACHAILLFTTQNSFIWTTQGLEMVTSKRNELLVELCTTYRRYYGRQGFSCHVTGKEWRRLYEKEKKNR